MPALVLVSVVVPILRVAGKRSAEKRHRRDGGDDRLDPAVLPMRKIQLLYPGVHMRLLFVVSPWFQVLCLAGFAIVATRRRNGNRRFLFVASPFLSERESRFPRYFNASVQIPVANR